jgi:hypothetical protein
MHAFKILALLTLTLNAGAGCDEALEFDAAGHGIAVRSGSGGYGGVWLNTSAIGSQPFSELDLTGALHDGVRALGGQIKGPNNSWVPVTKVEIIDGTLRVKAGQTFYSGAALVGARWQLALVDGQGVEDPREIWIAAVEVISAKESRYTFQTHDDEGQVSYLCDADASGSHAAALIKDVTIDPFTADMAPRKHTAYLACVSGAVGKAVTWGYRPWERSAGGVRRGGPGGPRRLLLRRHVMDRERHRDAAQGPLEHQHLPVGRAADRGGVDQDRHRLPHPAPRAHLQRGAGHLRRPADPELPGQPRHVDVPRHPVLDQARAAVRRRRASLGRDMADADSAV